MEKKVTGEIDWDMEMAKASDNSWKDEWLTIIFTIPLIMLLLGQEERVHAFFQALETAPPFYQYLLGVIVAASFDSEELLSFLRSRTMFFSIKYWWYGYLYDMGKKLSMLGWHKQKGLLEIKKEKRMAKKDQEILSEMHLALTEDLLNRIKSGEAKASELNVARQFLKDNDITAIPTDDSAIKQLVEELPFDEDGDALH